MLGHYSCFCLPATNHHHHPRKQDGTAQTVTYLLVLDSLNFCFWPNETWEYDNLARALKDAIVRTPGAFEPARLARLELDDFKGWFKGELDAAAKSGKGPEGYLPHMEERYRLVREVGQVLCDKFGGSSASMIRQAGGSAAALVDIVTSSFPGFRDSTVHNGEQVFFYKRAQIFVADVWGAFRGEGLGGFNDMEKLTMFADYRVPQLLHFHKVMRYSEELERRIMGHEVIRSGSAEEIEIRAATIVAVDTLRTRLAKAGFELFAVEIDWILWQAGEALVLGKQPISPHHRTLTIFY